MAKKAGRGSGRGRGKGKGNVSGTIGKGDNNSVLEVDCDSKKETFVDASENGVFLDMEAECSKPVFRDVCLEGILE
jgi:hypothetical protein